MPTQKQFETEYAWMHSNGYVVKDYGGIWQWTESGKRWVRKYGRNPEKFTPHKYVGEVMFDDPLKDEKD